MTEREVLRMMKDFFDRAYLRCSEITTAEQLADMLGMMVDERLWNLDHPIQ